MTRQFNAARALPASVLTALLVGCEPLPAEFHQSGAASNQLVEQGSAFGVRIGDSREQAKIAIGKSYPRFRFIYSTCFKSVDRVGSDAFSTRYTFGPINCNSLAGEDVYHATTGLSFANIEIMFEDDRVRKVQWSSGESCFC